MGSDSIPPKTLFDESIDKGLAFAHTIPFHRLLIFMSKTGECQQQKHTQHAPSTKTGIDYHNGWIKTRSQTLCIAGNAEEDSWI